MPESLESKVKTEWLKGSSIPENLFKINVKYNTNPHLAWRLRYETDKNGAFEDLGGYWYTQSIDPRTGIARPKGQIKYLKPLQNNDGEDIKYLTYPNGGVIVPFFAAVDAETFAKTCDRLGLPLPDLSLPNHKVCTHDLGYWRWVRDNSPYLIITEGVKKACCLAGMGFPTASVPGVWQSTQTTKDKRGKTTAVKLHPELKWLLEGCPKKVYLAYDSDYGTKTEVCKALTRTAKTLLKRGVEVLVIDWEDSGAKGVDDLVVLHGEQAFLKAFAEAMPWEEWQGKILKESFEQKAVRLLSEDYRLISYGQLFWLENSEGVFVKTIKEHVQQIVLNRLETLCPIQSDEIGTSKPGHDETAFGVLLTQRIAKSWAIKNQIHFDQINPPEFLPLQNGYLEMVDGKPHFHEYDNVEGPYFTYKSPATLEDWSREKCLEIVGPYLNIFDTPEQALTFFKLASCSLNLPAMRIHRGRNIKAVAIQGEGSNGKDSLANLFTLALGGPAVTHFELGDFKNHDKGDSKFPLYGLQNAKLNWGSENGKHNLEIQCLKKAITGEEIRVASKGIDATSFTPNCVLIFNANSNPALSDSQTALSSRWAFVGLNKTFGDHNDKFTIKADPRYRYDGQFIREQIAPALVRLMVILYEEVWADGISYECYEAKREEVLRESNHLYGFLEETIEKDPEGAIELRILFIKLVEYYEREEIATIEVSQTITGVRYKVKTDREEENRYDPIIKRSCDLKTKLTRFLQGTKWVETRDKNRNKVYSLQGYRLKDSSDEN